MACSGAAARDAGGFPLGKIHGSVQLRIDLRGVNSGWRRPRECNDDGGSGGV